MTCVWPLDLSANAVARLETDPKTPAKQGCEPKHSQKENPGYPPTGPSTFRHNSPGPYRVSSFDRRDYPYDRNDRPGSPGIYGSGYRGRPTDLYGDPGRRYRLSSPAPSPYYYYRRENHTEWDRPIDQSSHARPGCTGPGYGGFRRANSPPEAGEITDEYPAPAKPYAQTYNELQMDSAGGPKGQYVRKGYRF